MSSITVLPPPTQKPANWIVELKNGSRYRITQAYPPLFSETGETIGFPSTSHAKGMTMENMLIHISVTAIALYYQESPDVQLIP